MLDGNPAICQPLERCLSFAGYVVYAFTDPTDFLNSPASFGCIIVDSQLPDERSGADIIRHLRMGHAPLPAVLISAGIISPATLYELGDVEVLLKPFPTSTLLKAVAGALARVKREYLRHGCALGLNCPYTESRE